MKKFMVALALAVLVAIGGCAQPTQKSFVAMDGSKSDAKVMLGFTYNPMLERPEVDRGQADGVARQVCKSWGYDNATPFGSVYEKCTRADSLGCVQKDVMVNYQCIDEDPKTELKKKK